MRRRAFRSGFTLMEALIAIAILAVVLPVALAGVSAAGRAAGAAHRQQMALLLAQNKLNALVATGDWSAGSSSGGFNPQEDGDDAAGFRWQSEVTPWRVPEVRQLRVTVTREAGTPINPVALETLVVQPAEAEAEAEAP